MRIADAAAASPAPRRDDDPSAPPAPSALKQLQSEVEILRAFSHLNIVRYLGTQRTSSEFYIVMEHVCGGSVTQRLAARGQRGLGPSLAGVGHGARGVDHGAHLVEVEVVLFAHLRRARRGSLTTRPRARRPRVGYQTDGR